METNEQKAKAYDAVLERVKDMYTHTANGYAKQIMEQIFPELKESKSERIRREIIEFLKKQRQQTFVPYEWNDWLKEQKEFVSADFDEIWDTLSAEWTAQINGISKDVLRAVCQKWFSKGVEIERRKGLEKQGEHKSNWSEDDEYNREHLLGWINTLKTYIHHDTLVSMDLRRNKIDEVTKFENWLKSIKDRLNN